MTSSILHLISAKTPAFLHIFYTETGNLTLFLGKPFETPCFQKLSKIQVQKSINLWKTTHWNNWGWGLTSRCSVDWRLRTSRLNGWQTNSPIFGTGLACYTKLPGLNWWSTTLKKLDWLGKLCGSCVLFQFVSCDFLLCSCSVCSQNNSLFILLPIFITSQHRLKTIAVK